MTLPSGPYSADDIRAGIRFHTLFDSDCLALESPDDFGSFDGLDSEGVRVSFSVPMVADIPSVDGSAS